MMVILYFFLFMGFIAFLDACFFEPKRKKLHEAQFEIIKKQHEEWLAEERTQPKYFVRIEVNGNLFDTYKSDVFEPYFEYRYSYWHERVTSKEAAELFIKAVLHNKKFTKGDVTIPSSAMTKLEIVEAPVETN